MNKNQEKKIKTSNKNKLSFYFRYYHSQWPIKVN